MASADVCALLRAILVQLEMRLEQSSEVFNFIFKEFQPDSSLINWLIYSCIHPSTFSAYPDCVYISIDDNRNFVIYCYEELIKLSINSCTW